MNNTHQKHIHISDIKARLQKDVDAILASVDETALQNEFKDGEVVDIQADIKYNTTTDVIDERIAINIEKPKQKLSSFTNLLFKRFEY